MDTETKFFKWVDEILTQEIPEDVVAYNFNLYEGVKPEYHVQLIGASEFSKDNQDWACEEVFSTGENFFVIPHKSSGKKWQEGLACTVGLVKQYLKNGDLRDTLKSKKAVGVGFVDGDIKIVFQKR